MVRGIALVVAASVACGDDRGAPRIESRRFVHLCEAAFTTRDWEEAERECVGPAWRAHATLVEAWRLFERGERNLALTSAARLVSSTAAADAAYLAGYLCAHTWDDDPELLQREACGRNYLEAALLGYQHERRHLDAAATAGWLSRLPRPGFRFDDELMYTSLGVHEAKLSGDDKVLGRATTAWAEAMDDLGKVDAAIAAFLDAEKLLQAHPGDLAYAYFNHALVLADRGATNDLALALLLLDDAQDQVTEAIELGLGNGVKHLEVSIPLNRADVLCLMGEFQAAGRELDRIVDPDSVAEAKVRLLRGLIAVGCDDLALAQQTLDDAERENLLYDYRWRVARDLANAYRKVGDERAAERLYRKAIAIVEEMRGARDVDLRPWILHRRRSPYLGLLDLLATQDRGAEALEVAASLQARTWRDVAVSSIPSDDGDALRDARLRDSAEPVPSLTASELLGLVGAHEAVVFAELPDGLLRLHVVGGDVKVKRFDNQDRAALEVYRGALDDRDAAIRAAEILLPADLTTSDAPLLVVGDIAAETPLAALPWNQHRYLVEARPIAYLPGLAALRCPSGSWRDSPVVLGDAHRNLKHAADEVNLLASRLAVPALTGSSVTRAALERAKGSRLLHIAVHGVPTESGTVLQFADGELTASEVREMHLAPEVVVLSGCGTALTNTPESWSGFPSAFLASGSRFVISTLRSVEDVAAAKLVRAYYNQPDSLDPIHRLTAAQRVLAEAGAPPSEWASFSAWGSPTCGFP